MGPLGTHFSEILVKIMQFSYMKISLKMSSAKLQPFCLSFNVLSPSLLAMEYSAQTSLTPCQLMTWFLALPGHQQQQY